MRFFYHYNKLLGSGGTDVNIRFLGKHNYHDKLESFYYLKNMDYPTSFQAVDIVVLNKHKKTVLLGRKKNKIQWRFIGGFSEPTDSSLEYAARRELGEEASINLEVSPMVYIGSFRVDDPRYRNSEHKVMSAVFLCEYLWGFAKGGDDIEETQWVPYSSFQLPGWPNLQADGIVDEHLPLVQMLIDKGILNEKPTLLP